MSRIGIVIIGRNEGERLRRCLEAVRASGASVVYVDSGSTDGSTDLARQLGAIPIALDMSIPFTAAGARNAGFEHLLGGEPQIDYVQFVDGDCELRPGWLDAATGALESDPKLAAVCGHVRERFPERSIYNRMCDMEWNGPVGLIDATGGIAMMRTSAFRDVGGFDPSVPAGEEPELCARLRKAGWAIRRLDADMVWHDAAMERFGQWWTRQVRTGYGWLDIAHRFGQDDPALLHRTTRSTHIWTLGVTAAIVLAGIAGIAVFGWPRGLWLMGIVLALWPVQAIRIALRAYRRSQSVGTALAYGMLTLLGKWGQLVGQLRYRRQRRRGRNAQLIEYKSPAPMQNLSLPRR